MRPCFLCIFRLRKNNFEILSPSAILNMYLQILLNKSQFFIKQKMTATVHKDITDQFWIQKVKNGEVSNFNFCYRKIKICIFSQGARWIF